MTKRVVLIGNPVARSRSPAFQNAAFQAAGIDAWYDLAEVPQEAVPETVAALRGAEWLGANVTVPYKEIVPPLVDEISDAARVVGAVNTIINRGGRLYGDNSDIPGFAAAAREAGIVVAGGVVVLLGAGGAARAVAAAVREMGAARLVVANRTPTRAEAVAALWAGGDAQAMPLAGPELRDALRGAALVVNSIPVGLYTGGSPLSDEQLALLPATAAVYDLVYGRTPLLEAAERHGLRTTDGLGMLVHQGAVSWAWWTGRPAPLAAMWAAVRP